MSYSYNPHLPTMIQCPSGSVCPKALDCGPWIFSLLSLSENARSFCTSLSTLHTVTTILGNIKLHDAVYWRGSSKGSWSRRLLASPAYSPNSQVCTLISSSWHGASRIAQQYIQMLILLVVSTSEPTNYRSSRGDIALKALLSQRKTAACCSPQV